MGQKIGKNIFVCYQVGAGVPLSYIRVPRGNMQCGHGNGRSGEEAGSAGAGGGNPNDGESCSCHTVGEPSNGSSGMMWMLGALAFGFVRRKRG